MKTIPLTQGQFALIDDDDFERVNAFKWYAMWCPNTKSFYAGRNEGEKPHRRHIYMARFIMHTPKGMECDHIFHNTLDNQKSELRNCTEAENSKNKNKRVCSISGFKGVSWFKRTRKWLASIRVDGKSKHLGYFDDILAAARAYDEAAVAMHGAFAKTNFEVAA